MRQRRAKDDRRARTHRRARRQAHRARDAVAAAKQAVADNHTRRRTIDKDLLSAQQRLSKYKEKLMAVKTNNEYHAMQHQIAAGTAEVARSRRADARQHDGGRRDCRAAEENRSGAQERRGQHRQGTQGDRNRSRRMERVLKTSDEGTGGDGPADFSRHLDMFERVLKAGRASPSPKRPTASARSATSACARRSTTRSCATKRSSSATAASASSTSPACTSAPPPVRPRPTRPASSTSIPTRDGRDHGERRRRRARQPRSGGLRCPLADDQGNVLAELYEGIGVATNNVAEYRGLLAALEWALAHGHTRCTSSRIRCCSCSRCSASTGSSTKD